jgi:hypothetical protein
MKTFKKRVKRELREELILVFIALIVPLAMIPAMMGYV